VEIHIKGLKMCKRTKHKYHSTQAQKSEAHYQTNQGPDKEENKAKTQMKSLYLRRTPSWHKSGSPKEHIHQKWARLALMAVRPHHGCGCTLGQPTHHRLALVGC